MGPLRTLLHKLALVDFAKKIVRPPETALRKALYDGRVIAEYLESAEVPGLHIGAGGNLLKGWLNTYYYPQLSRIRRAREEQAHLIHLDALVRFPFDDGSFRYIFSEHMIEHIPYTGGLFMLEECGRVLQSGGKIRISTPNLAFFIGLFSENPDDNQRDYLEWSTNRYYDDPPFPHPTLVLNNMARNWYHQFIYDEEILTHSLESAGFVNVRRRAFGESEDEHLAGLETTRRMPAVYNEMESLILEAEKR
jgi:predicted SAM-dependent methyltransferase